ncbi:MAG: hypothetical protein JOY71_28860 [Acetobacteraceae bacterium]|nr:hypothetical protein [Acetobacteraceae bacterium]
MRDRGGQPRFWHAVRGLGKSVGLSEESSDKMRKRAKPRCTFKPRHRRTPRPHDAGERRKAIIALAEAALTQADPNVSGATLVLPSGETIFIPKRIPARDA